MPVGGIAAHAAGTGRVERTGDILADVIGQRIVISRERLKIDLAVSERGENRTRDRREDVDQSRDYCTLDLVLGVDTVELSQPVVKLHREGDADHLAHLLRIKPADVDVGHDLARIDHRDRKSVV